MAITESELNQLLDKHPDYGPPMPVPWGYAARFHKPTSSKHCTDDNVRAIKWLLYGELGPGIYSCVKNAIDLW